MVIKFADVSYDRYLSGIYEGLAYVVHDDRLFGCWASLYSGAGHLYQKLCHRGYLMHVPPRFDDSNSI